MHTYYIRAEVESAWRFDTLELENAKDKEIDKAFENQESWTCIVGESTILDYTKDYLDPTTEVFDEEDAEKVSSMIGDKIVCEGDYLPDGDEEFTLVVTNEDEEEILSISSSNLPLICCEQGYDYLDIDGIYCPDDFDEDACRAAKEVVERFLEKCEKLDMQPDLIFPTPAAGKWFWLNVQKCEMDEPPVFRLETEGDFDLSRLVLRRTLIEELVCGLNSMSAIHIIYDGDILEQENASSSYEDSTNYLIKKGKRQFPQKVYDMTNYESCEN